MKVFWTLLPLLFNVLVPNGSMRDGPVMENSLLASEKQPMAFLEQLQIFTVRTAIIDLKPKPVTIILAPDFDPSKDMSARNVKKEITGEVMDTLLQAFERSLETAPDGINWKFYPASFFADSIPTGNRLAWLQARYPHDVIALVSKLNTKISKAGVMRDSDTKTKTQSFTMDVTATLDLHSAKGLLKTYEMSRSIWLGDREVESGILSVGPAMGKNAGSAFEAAKDLANGLMSLFYPEVYFLDTYIDIKKDWMTAYNQLNQLKYDASIEELGRLLTQNNTDPNKGRLYFLRAISHFMKRDYDNAITDAQDADRLWASDRSRDLVAFLMKYTIENEVLWK